MKKSNRLTAREQRVDDWFEIPMIVVTIFLIVTFTIPLLVPLSSEWVQWFALLNLAVWSTFYVELFVKLYVAEDVWRTLKRNWSLAVIVAIPLFLPLRIMRASRLLGLIRILRLQPAVSKLKKSVRDLIYHLEYITITMLIFILSTGFILWQLETRFDGTITSLPDALWWALSTVTFINNAQITPTSAEGKLLGFFMGIVGMILLIIFIARISATMLSLPKK